MFEISKIFDELKKLICWSFFDVFLSSEFDFSKIFEMFEKFDANDINEFDNFEADFTLDWKLWNCLMIR